MAFKNTNNKIDNKEVIKEQLEKLDKPKRGRPPSNKEKDGTNKGDVKLKTMNLILRLNKSLIDDLDEALPRLSEKTGINLSRTNAIALAIKAYIKNN